MFPLDGVKVVDVTRVLAGPFCTMMLGDMGAEVLKIEHPAGGDESRSWAPVTKGWSSYFLGVNRNKKSVAIDLKAPDGAAAFRALLEEADVLIENLRPGALAQLGFGFDHVQRFNPRLIYCSISGYGATGPRASLAGYDVVIQGESGLMDITGERSGRPLRVGVAITDFLAGLYANQGILLALLHRQRTGKGQFIDIALFDSLISVLTLPVGILMATGTAPSRMGNEHPSVAPYETFSVGDETVVVAAGNPGLWKRVCQALSRPELADDPRFSTNNVRLTNRAALRRELESTMARYTACEVLVRLQALGVPCGKVRSIAEALEDPQIPARNMLLQMPNDELGAVSVLGNPIKLSSIDKVRCEPAPGLGEHTEEVLTRLKSRSRVTRSV